MGFGPGLKQQRNHNHGQRAVFLAPDFNLGEPAFANARVENDFEPFARIGIGKNDFRQFVAAKPAKSCSHTVTASGHGRSVADHW